MGTKGPSRLLRILIWVATLSLAGIAPAHAKRYMTSGFRSVDSRPIAVAVLPPHAQFIKAKAVMTEEMVKECVALENAAAVHIQKLLSEKGYQVRALSVEEIIADAELQEGYHRVNDRYQEEWRKIIRRPRRVKTRRYNVGDEAMEFAALLDGARRCEHRRFQ